MSPGRELVRSWIRRATCGCITKQLVAVLKKHDMGAGLGQVTILLSCQVTHSELFPVRAVACEPVRF
ncbi:hypothetical protein E8E14_005722 [Neopestalotiopsis sp. 37M]|nr:hypothetical protein E8E14_005722 [Neopestalotiopsis sp. 37M]